MTGKRLIHYDLLRIIAMLAVIVVHTPSTIYRYTTAVTTFDWQVANVFATSGKFSICVFVMISGMFFLNPEKNITIATLYKKNIFRIITAFLFWSLAYASLNLIIKIHSDGFSFKYIHALYHEVVYGHYHMWFSYMIVGIYIIVPFLRLISSDEYLMRYYLILSIIFASIIPVIQLVPVLLQFTTIADRLRVTFVIGWSGIFMLGYYLSKLDIKKKSEIIIYILGIVNLLMTIILNSLIAIRKNQTYEGLYELTNINILLIAVGVFVLFKNRISKINFSERYQKLILRLSECTFGIYLIHDFFIIMFQKFGFAVKLHNAAIAIPVLVVGVFVLSAFSITIIRKIPFAGKYIS